MFRTHRSSVARRHAARTLLRHELLEPRQLMTIVPLYSAAAELVPQGSPGFLLPDWWGQVIETEPGHGSLIASENGSLKYVPDAGYLGTDSFQLRNDDYEDYSYSNSVTLHVVESVFAAPDWARIEPHAVATTIDVLQNDYGFFGPDSDTFGRFDQQPLLNGLRIVSASGTDHGQVTVSQHGRSLDYNPYAGFSGTDSLTYTVEDSFGHQSTASVTVEVSGTPIDAQRYTSEAEFVHAQLDDWLARYAVSALRGSPFKQSPILYFDNSVVARLADLGERTFNATTPAISNVVEGDIVKQADGYLYVASNRVDASGVATHCVDIIDVRDPTGAKTVNSLSFDHFIEDLFISGDRLAVIQAAQPPYGLWRSTILPAEVSGTSVIEVVDVSTPTSAPTIYETTLDAFYSDAREVNGHLHFVGNMFDFLPAPGELISTPSLSLTPLVDRLAHADSFLPSVTVADAGGERTTPLFGWELAAKDSVSSTTIVTLDLHAENGLPADVDLSSAGFGATLYVSPDSLYLLGQTIEKFDFQPDGSGVDLAARGELHGHVPNQFAVDEHEGMLRVATQGSEDTWTGANVYVYAQHGESLEIVGSLTNLAPDEMVYSTRFDGDRAFIVTFQKVDPLFVIDLSNPAQPQLQGELKIPGYSNYLHVVDAHYVIGVGRAADEQTGLFGSMQLSLFDVSDPNQPRLVDRYDFENGRDTSSPLLNWTQLGDHQAFFYDADSGTLGIPFSISAWDDLFATNAIDGIRYFHVDTETGMSELGQVSFDHAALRSVVAGDHLISISNVQAKISPLSDVSRVITTIDLGTKPAQQRAFAARTPDVNDDGHVTLQDVLMLINTRLTVGFGSMDEVLPRASQQMPGMVLGRVDVNHDGYFSLLDAVNVINEIILNRDEGTDAAVADHPSALDDGIPFWNGTAMANELQEQILCDACSSSEDLIAAVFAQDVNA